ncbi:L-2-amino-thiazoline-4-carboxylic acid hydrolase [Enterocloster asparagiformis]|uniref:L-2-amino-thiazoline-4-carboxylic acid hydrolase n=1 Tax=Enterocloster asparagiformis TaxID=333367 RepID=UPI002354318A|nr:L-2-amino-thiazoline-4-carboxylic acid hydrolase [Enterocloster asparagiformis]
MTTIYDVPVLLRREIEALMIKPFLDAFEKELGHERTYEIAAEVVKGIAKRQGAEYAVELGGNDMEAMTKQEEAWTANDALVIDGKALDEQTLCQTIKRCAYVDMYERIGMKDMGYTLSCMRDEYFYEGFNPEMVMTRSKTLMTGGDCCDFCFKFPKKEG